MIHTLPSSIQHRSLLVVIHTDSSLSALMQKCWALEMRSNEDMTVVSVASIFLIALKFHHVGGIVPNKKQLFEGQRSGIIPGRLIDIRCFWSMRRLYLRSHRTASVLPIY